MIEFVFAPRFLKAFSKKKSQHFWDKNSILVLWVMSYKFRGNHFEEESSFGRIICPIFRMEGFAFDMFWFVSTLFHMYKVMIFGLHDLFLQFLFQKQTLEYCASLSPPKGFTWLLSLQTQGQILLLSPFSRLGKMYLCGFKYIKAANWSININMSSEEKLRPVNTT